jgi:hypothetical protein
MKDCKKKLKPKECPDVLKSLNTCVIDGKIFIFKDLND